MKGFRSTGMTAIVAALLIGCTAGVSPSPAVSLAPTPDLSAGTPGLVTGQLTWDDIPEGTVEWQEGSVAVDGGVRERTRVRAAKSQMSDPRLTGTVTVTDNADRFVVGTDAFVGDVLWGTVAIENEEGTWTGTLTGTTDTSAGGAGVSYIELVGAGAYEGLSAILFERETHSEPITIQPLDWNGVIFAGDLPPNR